jgi:hypothetical protein
MKTASDAQKMGPGGGRGVKSAGDPREPNPSGAPGRSDDRRRRLPPPPTIVVLQYLKKDQNNNAASSTYRYFVCRRPRHRRGMSSEGSSGAQNTPGNAATLGEVEMTPARAVRQSTWKDVDTD